MSELFAGLSSDRPDGDSRRYRRRARWRSLLALVVVVLLIAAAAGVSLYGVGRIRDALAGPPDYSGEGTGTVVVQVHAGDTAVAIGDTLVHDGVVKSVGAFVDAARSNSKSLSIGPGFYRLHRHMSGQDALALMLTPAALVQDVVPVPEGFSEPQVLARIAQRTSVSLAQLQAAAADPAALGAPAYAHGQLEGFLFPATYDFPPNVTAVQALTAMVHRFDQEAAAANLTARAAALGQTPYAIVTVASLIEREVANPGDYAKVARVVYNRLRLGMRLQFDSTVRYALHKYTGRVSDADTHAASPYNTYLHPGLPPTPIDSPGDAALQAALHPATGDWLYFITVNAKGSTVFTNNYQTFLAAKAQAQANGL